jgi:hypothetical protein
MNANVHGKMIYSSRKKMWHSITEPSEVDMTAEGVLDGPNFQGGFSIYLRPAKLMLNGEEQETGSFGIVRGASPYDKEERKIGFCSDRFHPLQPREVCRAFDTNVLQPAETMGFLGHGEDMFISWKMPSCDVVTVDGKDPIELFGIVRTGFDTLKGTRLFTSVFRPVCSNTINMAEGWAKSNSDGAGRGNIWKGKAVNKNLLRDLGYWMAHVQGTAEREATLLQNFFGTLAQER